MDEVVSSTIIGSERNGTRFGVGVMASLSYETPKENGTIIIRINGSCIKAIIVLDSLYEEYNENAASSCLY